MKYINNSNHTLKIRIDILGDGINEDILVNPGDIIEFPNYITQQILDQIAPHLSPIANHEGTKIKQSVDQKKKKGTK